MGYCLDLPDLFRSRAAAGRDKDREFCTAMLAHRYVTTEQVIDLVAAMPLDDGAQRRLKAAVRRWAKAVAAQGNDLPKWSDRGHFRTLAMTTKKTAHSWSDAKATLAALDRAGLLGLVQDLHAASKDNQACLRARLRLGDDVLAPYKAAIDRWLWPDVFKDQDTSVAKAKKAITDHRKASARASLTGADR